MIVIFYLDSEDNPCKEKYFDNEFVAAMRAIEKLRATGMTHVVMSNEPTNMVGKPGVSAVEDGKTPDGEKYEWSKAGRAGRVRDPNRTIYNDGEIVR